MKQALINLSFIGTSVFIASFTLASTLHRENIEVSTITVENSTLLPNTSTQDAIPQYDATNGWEFNATLRGIFADSSEDTTHGLSSYEIHRQTDDQITIQFGNGSTAIASGSEVTLPVQWNGTIESVTMLCDQVGGIVVDIYKDTYVNYPPTSADTITSSEKPTISSDDQDYDGTLTGWTVDLTKGDVLKFHVDSASTVTECTVTLGIGR